MPLSRTLDTVGALTRSVSDAIVAHEILAARRVTRNGACRPGVLAVPQTLFLEGMDATVAQALRARCKRCVAQARTSKKSLCPR